MFFVPDQLFLTFPRLLRPLFTTSLFIKKLVNIVKAVDLYCYLLIFDLIVTVSRYVAVRNIPLISTTCNKIKKANKELSNAGN